MSCSVAMKLRIACATVLHVAAVQRNSTHMDPDSIKSSVNAETLRPLCARPVSSAQPSKRLIAAWRYRPWEKFWWGPCIVGSCGNLPTTGASATRGGTHHLPNASVSALSFRWASWLPSAKLPETDRVERPSLANTTLASLGASGEGVVGSQNHSKDLHQEAGGPAIWGATWVGTVLGCARLCWALAGRASGGTMTP